MVGNPALFALLLGEKRTLPTIKDEIERDADVKASHSNMEILSSALIDGLVARRSVRDVFVSVDRLSSGKCLALRLFLPLYYADYYSPNRRQDGAIAAKLENSFWLVARSKCGADAPAMAASSDPAAALQARHALYPMNVVTHANRIIPLL